MPYTLPLYSAKGYGKKTATAGTAIVQLIEPVKNAFTRLADFWYTAGTTAHTLTIMRPLNKTTLSAAAAAAQKVLALTADPGVYSAGGTFQTADNPIAANDYVVYELADGTFQMDTVASVSGLNVTLTNNVPTGGALAGAVVWWFGITTDTNPNNGQAHPQLNGVASQTTKFGSDPGTSIAGIIGTIPGSSKLGYTNNPMNGKYEPILIYSDNSTAAGTLEKVTAIYTSK